MKDSIRLISRQVQGESALAYVRKITPYHRIQASTGYRAAAHEVLGLLEKEIGRASCRERV